MEVEATGRFHDGGLEIGTGGLLLRQRGLPMRESGLACSAKALALTNKSVLDCTHLVLGPLPLNGSDQRRL